MASELIQKVVAAVEAGDFARIAGLMAPDGVFQGTLGGIDEAFVMRGPDAVAEYFADVANTWDEWRFEAEQVMVNGDTFVVFWKETSRSREIEMNSATATLFTVGDGKITYARGFLDRDAARAAAGLG